MREEKRGRRRERERVLRTDENARLRESVLSEPFVERFSNVSREFKVLLLIFSYRDVGSSVEKQGPSISQRRGKRRGREEERERRQDELVKQDICRLENRVGEKTEMELIVRDFGYRSVLLISDFALGKGRTTTVSSSSNGRKEGGKTRARALTFQVVILFNLPIGVIVLRIQAISACSGTCFIKEAQKISDRTEKGGRKGKERRRAHHVLMVQSAPLWIDPARQQTSHHIPSIRFERLGIFGDGDRM